MDQFLIDIIFAILPYAAVAPILGCFLYAGYLVLGRLSGADEKENDDENKENKE